MTGCSCEVGETARTLSGAEDGAGLFCCAASPPERQKIEAATTTKTDFMGHLPFFCLPNNADREAVKVYA
jgi:hypothetical protein